MFTQRLHGDAGPDPRRQRRRPAAQARHDPARGVAYARPYKRPIVGFLAARRRRLGPDRRRPADPEVHRRRRRHPGPAATSSSGSRWPSPAIAVVDAGVSLLQRWYSARVGEGLIYDLRTEVFIARPAPADRVLHPHPDRLAGLPDQQRRHGRPAGVHLDAVRRRVQPRLAGPGRRRDVLPVLADHRWPACCCCRSSCSRRATWGSGWPR